MDIKGLLSGFSQYRESITITLLVFSMSLMEEISDEESKRLGPVRVVKCQFFYTEQKFKLDFTPRKAHYFGTVNRQK